VRSLGKRGSGQSAGQLGITQDTHSHILATNPFIYKVHQKATLQYQQATDLALGHCLAHQSYSAMRRVLETSNLSIDRKTYYNLVRGKPLDQSNHSFEGLVRALEEVGFKFTCSMDDELAEDGSIKGRILEQLFMTDAQIAYARRFIADQVLLIDGTFKTNRLGMVLLVVAPAASVSSGRLPSLTSCCSFEERSDLPTTVFVFLAGFIDTFASFLRRNAHCIGRGRFFGPSVTSLTGLTRSDFDLTQQAQEASSCSLGDSLSSNFSASHRLTSLQRPVLVPTTARTHPHAPNLLHMGRDCYERQAELCQEWPRRRRPRLIPQRASQLSFEILCILYSVRIVNNALLLLCLRSFRS
jgi:hypothetical protein